MSKLTIENNIVKFDMRVRKTMNQDQVLIPVEVNVEAMTKDEMLNGAFGGTNLRITLANKVRDENTQQGLVELGMKGIKLNYQDISAKRVQKPADLLGKLSRADFVDFMDEEYGIEESAAIRMYNKKHGIVENN